MVLKKSVLSRTSSIQGYLLHEFQTRLHWPHDGITKRLPHAQPTSHDAPKYRQSHAEVSGSGQDSVDDMICHSVRSHLEGSNQGSSPPLSSSFSPRVCYENVGIADSYVQTDLVKVVKVVIIQREWVNPHHRMSVSKVHMRGSRYRWKAGRADADPRQRGEASMRRLRDAQAQSTIRS